MGRTVEEQSIIQFSGNSSTSEIVPVVACNVHKATIGLKTIQNSLPLRIPDNYLLGYHGALLSMVPL